jgi:Protein of unknown function (DUF2931)
MMLMMKMGGNRNLTNTLQWLCFLLCIGLQLAVISSCKPNKEEMMQTETFEYLAQVSGDVFCPVEIYDARFICSDQSTVFIPTGEYLDGIWGSANGVMDVGPDKKKVPESIEITWFSYAEDKFYQGSFELPQQKMYDLFKKDYGTYKNRDGTESKYAYIRLVLGIAPQGMLTLWMKGVGSIEIGTFQARQTLDVEWSSFSKNLNRYQVVNNTQKDMLPFVQEAIAKHEIKNTYFKNRLQRYQYTIGTNRPDFKIYDYSLHFINLEYHTKVSSGLEFLTDTLNDKAVPYSVNLFIEDKFLRTTEIRIWVDLLDGKTTEQNDHLEDPLEEIAYYNQMMDRFKTFFANNKDVQLYIKFDNKIVKSNIDKPVYCGKVCLKSPTDEMEIENSRVEVYDAYDENGR